MSFFDYSNTIDYPLFFDICDTHGKNQIFAKTITNHHQYMKHVEPPQRRIKWNIYETQSGNLVGGIGISSCVLALGSRDKFIGWDMETRLKNSNCVANNYRYGLIKPNITIKNVGSMVLKLLREEGRKVWKEKYGDELVLLETFVKPPWKGTVYKADNWNYLGMTKGNSIQKAPVLLWKKEDSARGKLARENPEAAIAKYAVGNKGTKSGEHYKVKKSEPKLIFVKPLIKKWKKILNDKGI